MVFVLFGLIENTVFCQERPVEKLIEWKNYFSLSDTETGQKERKIFEDPGNQKILIFILDSPWYNYKERDTVEAFLTRGGHFSLFPDQLSVEFAVPFINQFGWENKVFICGINFSDPDWKIRESHVPFDILSILSDGRYLEKPMIFVDDSREEEQSENTILSRFEINRGIFHRDFGWTFVHLGSPRK